MIKFKKTSVAKALAVTLGIGAFGWAYAGDDKGIAYISNQDGGVSIIDLDSMTKSGELAAGGKSPRGIGVTADGKHVLTANKDSGDMSVFDAATKKLLKSIAIGQNPEFIRVYRDHAYITYEPSAKSGPPGQAEKDDDDDNEQKLPAGIAVVDLKEFKVLRTITSGPETEGVEFSADGKLMLVTNEGDNTITVYGLPDGKLVKTIDTSKQGARPRGIKISPDGQLYAVTLEYGDKVMIMDREFKPLKTMQTGKTPYGVTFDREGKRLFVAASRAKQLQVFDTKSFELVKSIPTGDRCWHFTFTPDDSKILLTCGKSNELIVLDAKTYAVIKKIGELKTPWGVVAYPKAMGSLDAP
jgi:YVTN family beta-propeller protein